MKAPAAQYTISSFLTLALKGSMMSKGFQILAILALLLPVLTACNTFEGLGQDVQKAGSSLEKAADKNK